MKNIFCLLAVILALQNKVTAQNTNPSPDCSALLHSCGSDIIKFAENFVPPTDLHCKLWNGSCNTDGEIWRNGTVSIGTAFQFSTNSPLSPKLVVKGGIMSEQLQICRAAWCDYVFDDTFHLLPLKSVADFIHQYKHLPGCTPGPELEAQHGFALDEQTVQQQQKIEESFLHLIHAGERVDALKAGYASIITLRTSQVQPNCDPGPEFTDKVRQIAPDVVCTVLKSASASSNADGIAGITINNAVGPFNIYWGSGQLENVQCDGLIRIPNLLPGDYFFKVTDSQGQFIGDCGLTIGIDNSPCSILTEYACQKAILDLIKKDFANIKSDCKQWEGDACDKTGLISRKGNVCIGTSISKAGYSLAVGSGILTDNFKIKLCSGAWCDYVFEPDYVLKPLREVKAYLLQYKSLPGMVTQAEVSREGGYEVKTVKIDQQKKIEEAFLYLIQLHQEIDSLNQSLENLN